MAAVAVQQRGVPIALACRAFGVSETCYRYGPKLRAENEQISDLLTGLTDARLTVSETSLGFYESSCDVMEEKAGEDGARLLTLQCYGSGEEWPATGSVTQLQDGNLSLQIDDFAQVYLPCDPSN